MKRIIYIALAALAMLATSACQQLEEINDRLDDHEDRITALEEQCRKLTSNIEALQTITTALQQNDYVTKITCIEENGQEIGYRMTFAKSGEVTVYNSIADGTTPQFKISEGYWYASFDDGATWHQLGKVGAESGPEPLFSDVTYDEDYIYLKLTDGTKLSIPMFDSETEEESPINIEKWILGENVDPNGKFMKYVTYARSEHIVIQDYNALKYASYSDEMFCTIAEFSNTQDFIIRTVFDNLRSSDQILKLNERTKYIIVSYGRTSTSGITMTIEDTERLDLKFVKVEEYDDKRWDIIEDVYQLNNGLKETSAGSCCNCWDSKYGFLCVTHNTHSENSHPSYGESDGKSVMQIFAPTQPWNNIEYTIEDGGANRTLLSPSPLSMGNGKVRVFWTRKHTDHCVKYRDYDFATNKLSDEILSAKILIDNEELDINASNISAYLTSKGYSGGSAAPIVSKFFQSDGVTYVAIAQDQLSYGIICRISMGYRFEPIAICPTATEYELQATINGTNIYCLGRYEGYGGVFYQKSPDMGETWEPAVKLHDSAGSRPQIDWYCGGLLICYNYLSKQDTENFPAMHQNRNSIRILWGMEEDPNNNDMILESFSKYGFVEYSMANVHDDLYLIYATTRQALKNENDNSIEHAKEAIVITKLGYIL